jgi:hypothetical protein
MTRVRLAPWLALLVACGGNREEVSTFAHAVIGDAAHGGRAGFYFLPPLAPPTALPPTFDGSLTLTARLAAPGGAEITSVPLAVHDDHYQSHLDTEGLVLDPTVGYRLSVTAGALELGYADVQVFQSEQQARSSASSEAFELVDGKKLLVKVYANLCAAVECAPASPCRAAATCDPVDGSCVAGEPLPDGTACGAGATCQGGVCPACTNAPTAQCGVPGSSDGTRCCQVGLDQKVCCGKSKLYARRVCTPTRPTCPEGGTYPACANGVFGCPAGSTACDRGCCVDCGGGQLNDIGGAGCAVCEGPDPWETCEVELVDGACVATVNGGEPR